MKKTLRCKLCNCTKDTRRIKNPHHTCICHETVSEQISRMFGKAIEKLSSR